MTATAPSPSSPKGKAGTRVRMPALINAKRQLFGETKDRQHAPELRIVRQSLVGPHGAEPVGILSQPGRHSDPGPAADPRQHCNVLLSAMSVGVDIADDPRRGFE